MSHLPIKVVDHYLDQIDSKHVLFVGGIAIILIITFGPWLSNAMYNKQPDRAPKAGGFSDHYPDGILRTPTVPSGTSPVESISPQLFGASPFVIPPYQSDNRNYEF